MGLTYKKFSNSKFNKNLMSVNKNLTKKTTTKSHQRTENPVVIQSLRLSASAVGVVPQRLSFYEGRLSLVSI